jgi:transketolase
MTRAATPPRPVDPELLRRVAHTIRGLAIDAVEQARSGHPGMPLGCADLATVLWTQFLAHDPSAPSWPDRDRFVLSAGHGSMLLYALLHLSGYELPLAELRRFRQLGSHTPGHPEYGDTVGVEVTTGPLGTGFAAAVGMALGERMLAARYNRPGHAVVDHFTYVIASDGDLMEGVCAEAASFAGHQQLGKLVVLWDDNAITIDGGTELAFGEDVRGRFAAYGWHVEAVDGHDAAAIAAAIARARGDARPSLIACKTVIGRFAPTKAGSSASHGSPLGAAELAGTKAAMGWPDTPFFVPDDVRDAMAAGLAARQAERAAWEQAFAGYAAAHPELAAELTALWAGELPAGTGAALDAALAKLAIGSSVATRKASNVVLEALTAVHPTLVGGSADLAGSNGTKLDRPAMASATPDGVVIHFGVREHAMAAICNGLALHGGLRPYDATFLIFSDFMRGALRLSALMKLPVIHLLSHDSFWVGEDGPTHQPIEQTMSLRLIPGLRVVRPADARETVGAWQLALARRDGPTAILLTRQNLPVLAQTRPEGVAEGAYVLWEPPGTTVAELAAVVIATGSEVELALAAAQALHAEGRHVRVVSMPSWSDFAAQPPAARDAVIPTAVPVRLSVEAGVTLGWERWATHHIGLDRFGASAPGEALAEHFGFTAAAVTARLLELTASPG